MLLEPLAGVASGKHAFPEIFHAILTFFIGQFDKFAVNQVVVSQHDEFIPASRLRILYDIPDFPFAHLFLPCFWVIKKILTIGTIRHGGI